MCVLILGKDILRPSMEAHEFLLALASNQTEAIYSDTRSYLILLVQVDDKGVVHELPYLQHMAGALGCL